MHVPVLSLSNVTGEWSSPAVTGTKPPPLSVFSFTKVDSKRAVVYGGGQVEELLVMPMYLSWISGRMQYRIVSHVIM